MGAAAYRDWIENELFERSPLNISVIDRDYRIVAANRNFVSLFGEAEGRKCHQVHVGRDEPCPGCVVAETFGDGRPRVSDQLGIAKSGRPTHYQVHVAPITNAEGSVPYVVEMSTDITEAKRLELEYRTLFEQVPCYVTVLDQDQRILKANARFTEKFGNELGRPCYGAFKRRETPCESCPARETLADGRIHSSEQVGVSRDGELTHYIVTTAPASDGPDGDARVIETALDVTDLRAVETKLLRANVLRESLVEHSPDAIIGTGPLGHLLIFNPAAERLFGVPAGDVLGRALPSRMVPSEFESVVEARKGACVLEATTITGTEGEDVPVRFTGHALEREGEFLGTAAFLQDLRPVRQLEREKIDAERLAAVGQTVAGLAHGIKNILTGLKGGMYFLQTGLEGGRKGRLEEGWGMLERNMKRISELVLSLLSFSKGRVPKVEVVHPGRFVTEIAELFREAALHEDIHVVPEIEDGVAPAPLDAAGIHDCLANLVSNAIDACQTSGRKPCHVHVRVHDRGDDLVFEVEDEGCGMDQKVRNLAFTNFFTTKGSGGTGLGLLLTRKITQEHGGRIELETTPDRGSVFRLIFPRDRLPAPAQPARQGGMQCRRS